jgi:hypothetical protein
VFDTDCLSWDFRRCASEVEPGRCEVAAWGLEESPTGETAWTDAIDETFPKTCVIWERIARSAIKRLAPLLTAERPAQPHASFAFAWFVPRYLSFGTELANQSMRFPDEYPKEELFASDQRLSRLLESAGMEGTADASREP